MAHYLAAFADAVTLDHRPDWLLLQPGLSGRFVYMLPARPALVLQRY